MLILLFSFLFQLRDLCKTLLSNQVDGQGYVGTEIAKLVQVYSNPPTIPSDFTV